MLGGVHAALLFSVCTLTPPTHHRPATADAPADVRLEGAVAGAPTVNSHGQRISAASTHAVEHAGDLPSSSTLNLYAPVNGQLPPDETPNEPHQPVAGPTFTRARRTPVKFARSLLSKYFKTAKLVAPPPFLLSDTLRGSMQL